MAGQIPGGNPGPLTPAVSKGKDVIMRQGQTAKDLYGYDPMMQGPVKEVSGDAAKDLTV